MATRLVVAVLTAAFAGAVAPSANAAEISVPRDGVIGYALSSLFWSVYQTPDGKAECPQGFNTFGPRETFKGLFPQDKGQKWMLQETHLAREIEGWYPSDKPEKFPYLEAQGPVAIGMDLDGRTGAEDFTSPDGEKGIDNQLFRVLGCQNHYRLPDGQTAFFDSKKIVDDRYNRIMIEISGVDSLVDDSDVQVTILRGLDHLLRDATGNRIMPGGSQRVDAKRGGRFVRHINGKIVGGVLTTESEDVVLPWETTPGTHIDANPTVQIIHDLRFRLKLATDRAEGLMAGYVDIDNWYYQMMKAESTHHQAYGQLSPPGLARSLWGHADAYPDPKTGKNTAISAALTSTWTQVFIIHPPQAQAALQQQQRAGSSAERTGARR